MGWRNPQEDAYDITSIQLNYSSDGTVDAKCIDGYANGSISTRYYNPGTQAPYYTQNWGGYDIHNITIKEWTDAPDDIDETEEVGAENVKVMKYRIKEEGDANNCEITQADFSKYPFDANLARNKQTFSITYKKPFKATGL